MVKRTRHSRIKNAASLPESKLLLRFDQLQSLVSSQAANTLKQIEAYLGIQHYLATGQLLPDFHGWLARMSRLWFVLDHAARNSIL